MYCVPHTGIEHYIMLCGTRHYRLSREPKTIFWTFLKSVSNDTSSSIITRLHLEPKEPLKVCVLEQGKINHTNLNIYLQPNRTKFQVEGEAKIHLTGYRFIPT